jgi:hypothetical protein
VSLRRPSNAYKRISDIKAGSSLETEVAAEQAAALGRAGQKVADALHNYRASIGNEDNAKVRQVAVDATFAFLVQRETIGLRDHRGVIKDLAIPPEILRRLGATLKQF